MLDVIGIKKRKALRKELLCVDRTQEKVTWKERIECIIFFSRANVYLSLRAPSSSSSLMKWGVRSPFFKTLLSLKHLLVAVSFNRFRNRGTWKGWKIGVVPRFYSLQLFRKQLTRFSSSLAIKSWAGQIQHFAHICLFYWPSYSFKTPFSMQWIPPYIFFYGHKKIKMWKQRNQVPPCS